MTLLVPHDQLEPTFDLIACFSISDKFPIRRLPTLAQRFLLSEKHIPLKPSASFYFRKCYCSNTARLYKLNKQYKNRNSLVKAITFKKRSEQFVQIYEFNKITKITVNTNRMPLSESFLQIKPQQSSFPDFSFTNNSKLKIEPPAIELNNFCPRNLSFSLIQTFEKLPIKNEQNHLKVSTILKDIYSLNHPDFIQTFFARPIYVNHLMVTNFSLLKLSFVSLAFHIKSFPLQVTNTDILTRNPHTFVQATSQLLDVFQPTLEKTCARFEFHNEIGKNLIIGTRAKLDSLSLVKTTINTLPHLFSSSMRTENSDGLIKHNLPANHKIRLQTKEQNYIQALLIQPIFKLHTSTTTQLQQSSHNRLAKFREKASEKNVWLRLKLRLQKFCPDNPQLLAPKPLIKHTALPCIPGSSLLNKICLFMPPRSKERPLKLRQETLSSIYSRVHLCSKTSKIFLKTRSQALYTRNLMRKLIAIEAFQKSRKQYFEPGQLGSFIIANAPPKTHRIRSSALIQNINHIRTRPLNFCMQISAMNFTDIELPMHRRRLIPPQGVFPSSFTLNVKTRSLLPLRLFFASSVITRQHMSSNILKPIRRISPIFIHLKHFALPTERLTLNANYLVSKKNSHKKANMAIRSTLQGFHYNSSVPNSIYNRLKLNFAILDDTVSTRQLTINFSTPTEWEKSWRKFNCKLILMPFAFGFPRFSYKLFLPKLMNPPHEFQPLSDCVSNTRTKSSYLLSNFKNYYHPLSQKKPKKWLYSFTHTDTFKVENYKYSYTKQFLEVSTRDTLKEFAYTWYIQKSAKLFYSIRPINSEKTWPKKVYLINHKPVASAFCQKTDIALSNIEYSGIKRLLLRIPSNSKVKVKNEPFALDSRFVHKAFKPDDVKLSKDLKSQFSSHYRHFSIICRNILAFEQKLSYPEQLKLIKLTRFNAMFRVFRFPYVPEHSMIPSALPENWFSLEDTSTEMNNNFSDDIRATQIFYAFDFFQNSLDFILNSLPASHSLELTHSRFEPGRVLDLRLDSATSLCSHIKIAHKYRNVSIPDKYIFFPEQKPGDYKYLSESTLKTVPAFPCPQPRKSNKRFILQSKTDQDFIKQELNPIRWVIMLKNFMYISHPALRYSRPHFCKASTDQNAFTTSWPAKPLKNFPEFVLTDFRMFSAQVPDFFAGSLKHDLLDNNLTDFKYTVVYYPTSMSTIKCKSEFNQTTINFAQRQVKAIRPDERSEQSFACSLKHSLFDSKLTDFKYTIASYSTNMSPIKHRSPLSQTTINFNQRQLKAIRLDESYGRTPALISAIASDSKNIDLDVSFPIESGVRNYFVNIFSSFCNNTEQLKHPGYPDWIDMDIDILHKKADSDKDMTKFLLVPLTH